MKREELKAALQVGLEFAQLQLARNPIAHNAEAVASITAAIKSLDAQSPDVREFEWALGQLRHLYKQMKQGIALDPRHAAQGLLGPAIEKLENYQTIALHSNATVAALKVEINALFTGLDRLAQAQQIVVTALDNTREILGQLFEPKDGSKT